MSTYHLKNEYLPAYIAKLNAFQPELIDGYPSAVYVLAKYLLQERVKLDFVPLAISVTAETLMEHHRQAIEKAFGCKVYNQYASSEGAPWIVECSYGSSHLWLDTGVFEFLNPQPLDDETYMAELVVTSFRNFKTALIRYRIGDYVQLFKNPPVCACGAPYPVIKGIIGRNDDILFTEEKGSVGRLDPAYKGVQGIRQSKIVQHDLGNLEVLLVPEKDYDSNQQILLLQNLRDRLGQDIEIKFTLLDSIPLGKAGKLRSVERRFSLPEKG
jgi:phenylacetate-CoA ligase